MWCYLIILLQGLQANTLINLSMLKYSVLKSFFLFLKRLKELGGEFEAI